MKQRQTTIFAVKNDDDIIYIGKTDKEKLNKSNFTYFYLNKEIRNIILNKKVFIEPIKKVNSDEWYPSKIDEVVSHYKLKHPLLNADWMKKGKRSYWDGKKKDTHTLNRLSESKYRKVVQYDNKGILNKIWDSRKDVAIEIFKDYKILNGSAKSKIYYLLKAKNIKKRLYNGSYFFKYQELIDYFNTIPKKIHIDKIFQQQKRKELKITHKHQYTINLYDINMKFLRKFDNAYEASIFLGVSANRIRMSCKRNVDLCGFILKYGEKKMQSINNNLN